MHSPDSKFSCPVCSTEETAGAPVTVCPHGECRLQELPDGARTHVRELRGCRHLRSRLYSLGFIPGTEIMVQGRGDAGCRVQVKDTCVVLDSESADSILCDAVGGGNISSLCGHMTLKGLFERHGRRGRKGENHG